MFRKINGADNKKEKEEKRSFNLQVAIAPALIIAAICGFFPISGITSQNPSEIRFSYWNWRSFHSYIIMFGSLCMGLISVYRMFVIGAALETAGDIMFFMGNAIGMLIFFHLAINWKELITAWNQVEITLPPITRKTKIKIRIMIIAITFLSLFEHLSADANTMAHLLKEEPPSWGIIDKYFQRSYMIMFTFMPYSTVLGVIFCLINLIDVIVWNYLDLIIILISISLNDLFHSVNIMFDKAQGKLLDREDWRLLRETYNKLYLLTNLIDDKLSFFVLFSFGSNLYFICLQLLHSLKPMKSVSQKVYFYSSFGYLLGRTIAVCLSASSVPVAAKHPLKSLFSAPSHSYNIEIQRLITQITSDDIGLTGCKFFTVTRNLIISILGTIITYEIVLIQFNSLNEDNTNASSSTLNKTMH